MHVWPVIKNDERFSLILPVMKKQKDQCKLYVSLV